MHQTPSSEEDHQVLSERLIHLQEQSVMAKKKGKEKQKEGDSSPQRVRRSSRLKGELRKTQTKGPHFIDLVEETPEQTPAGHSPSHSQSHIEHSPSHSQPDVEHSPPHSQSNVEISPQDVDMSPFQPDFEVNSPPWHFGDSPVKKTLEIDPKQQEVYDYIESL